PLDYLPLALKFAIEGTLSACTINTFIDYNIAIWFGLFLKEEKRHVEINSFISAISPYLSVIGAFLGFVGAILALRTYVRSHTPSKKEIIIIISLPVVLFTIIGLVTSYLWNDPQNLYLRSTSGNPSFSDPLISQGNNN